MAQPLARPLALDNVPPEPMADAEYQAIRAAFEETERGRRFLTEHARRNRQANSFADTQMVLAAIARVEASIRGEPLPPLPPAPERLRQGLLALAGIIAEADRDVIALTTDSFERAPQQANTVASTFRDLRDRIATMLDEWDAAETVQAPEALIAQAEMPAPLPPLRLVEPEAARPKLPPAPLLIPGKPPEAESPEPFVPFEFEPLDFEPAKTPAGAEALDVELFAPEAKTDPPAMTTPLPPAPAIADNASVKRGDPMAPVMALSPEERIALFS